MTTNFPSSTDNSTSLPVQSASDTLANNHVASHKNLSDAVIAVETKLGVDGSADTTSIDYKLKSAASIDPGHKHTNSSVTIALSQLSDTNISSPSDGSGLFFDAASGKWKPGSASVADASTSVKGVTKLSVAPAVSSNPIAVGDNDPRFTTTSGTTLDGSTDKIVDSGDVSASASANKVARRNSNGDLAVNTTPTNSTDAASKSYVDTGDSFVAGVITDLSATTAGNNDVTVTTTFTPRLIRLHYWIQGHDAVLSTNNYLSEKGTAVFNGTTLEFVTRDWTFSNAVDQTAPSAGSSTNLGFNITPNSTSSPSAGDGTTGTGGAIKVTLSIASVSSTSFVIRRATTVPGSNSNNARAAIAYEAFA